VKKVTVSDYVIKFLEERGIKDIFLVSGGGIMYLLDSVGRSSHLTYHCNFHEQASAVCAESYARITGGPGVCFATVGPGAINAISGLLGAWVDSVPVLLITGQVRTTLIADYSILRQYGPQEANAVGVATPVTKYATTVNDPMTIRCVLEQAFYEMTTGRPGPVMIEIPLDIQNAEVDPAGLPGFLGGVSSPQLTVRADDWEAVITTILAADRPVFIAGNGVRASGGIDVLIRIAERLGIPMLFPFSAKDLVPETHPLQMGVFGTAGQRRANFALQNADCVISVGVGLNIQKVGFNPQDFARKAVKIVVDIDSSQLRRQAIIPDYAIQADARYFLTMLDGAISSRLVTDQRTRWLEICELWKRRYPPVTSEHLGSDDQITSYFLIDRLSDLSSADDIVITGNGIDAVTVYQAFRVRARTQRVLISGWGSMGWDLPFAYGAHVAGEGRRVICICGDGSIQWNIQELLTISKNASNVKIFVLNNQGYTAIRTTQDSLFGGRYVGSEPSSGVHNPNFEFLAAAYSIEYKRASVKDELTIMLRSILESTATMLVEVMIDPKQAIFPKASAFRRDDGVLESRPLEDMSPFLPRDELRENMSYFSD
jgi:acetolactate synthase-1/2/3 large subunit